MTIVSGFPPNYEDICRFFPVSIYSIFAYGENIYVHPLSEHEILPDMLVHEGIHAKQQTSPSLWWNRWLVDKDFRLEQELEAYAHQYAFIQKNVPTKYHKEFLFSLANDLASEQYGLGGTYQQFEHLIRLTAKELVYT